MFDYNLIDIIIRSTSELCDVKSKEFFPGSHYRLQPIIPKKYAAMDDASPESLNKLLEIAEKFIQENSDLIDHICTKCLKK